jgi:hypothetical protein
VLVKGLALHQQGRSGSATPLPLLMHSGSNYWPDTAGFAGSGCDSAQDGGAAPSVGRTISELAAARPVLAAAVEATAVPVGATTAVFW